MLKVRRLRGHGCYSPKGAGWASKGARNALQGINWEDFRGARDFSEDAGKDSEAARGILWYEAQMD